jgi:hypothetical protein
VSQNARFSEFFQGWVRLTSRTTKRWLLRTACVSHAHFIAPFVLEVEYGYGHARLAGEGGTIRYFSLFGHVIRLNEKVVWVS